MAIYIKSPGDEMFEKLMAGTQEIINAVKQRRLLDVQLGENARSTIASTDPERRAAAIDAMEKDRAYRSLKKQGFFDNLRKQYGTPTTAETAKKTEAQAATLKTVGYGPDGKSWQFPMFNETPGQGTTFNRVTGWQDVTDDMRQDALREAGGDVAAANKLLQENALALPYNAATTRQARADIGYGVETRGNVVGAPGGIPPQVPEQVSWEGYKKLQGVGYDAAAKATANDVLANEDNRTLAYPTAKEGFARYNQLKQAYTSLGTMLGGLMPEPDATASHYANMAGDNALNARLRQMQAQGVSVDAMNAVIQPYLDRPITEILRLPPDQQVSMLRQAMKEVETELTGLGKKLASNPDFANQTGIDPQTGLVSALPHIAGPSGYATTTVQYDNPAKGMGYDVKGGVPQTASAQGAVSALAHGLVVADPWVKQHFANAGQLVGAGSQQLAYLATQAPDARTRQGLQYLSSLVRYFEAQSAEAQAALVKQVEEGQ